MQVTVTFELDPTSERAPELLRLLTGANVVTGPEAPTAKKAAPRKRTAAANGRRKVTSRDVSAPTTREIREWARQHGFTVAQRGTIKADVREAYAAAH